MKGVAVLLLILLLAACGHMKPAPAPQIQTVKEVVTIPCRIEAPEEPLWAFDQLAPADRDKLDPQVNALLVEREQRKGYVGKVQAAIQKCQ